MYLLLNMLVEFLSIMTYQDNFFNDCSQVARYHFYIKNIKWDSQPFSKHLDVTNCDYGIQSNKLNAINH